MDTSKMAETENAKSEEPVLPRTVQSKETVEQELTQFLMPQVREFLLLPK